MIESFLARQRNVANSRTDNPPLQPEGILSLYFFATWTTGNESNETKTFLDKRKGLI
jgi:hypothetical protein